MNGQRPAPKDDQRNDTVKQIFGNKTDTALTAAADTGSLVGYAKGICTAVNTTIPGTITTLTALHTVPTTDATTNVYMREVVGNKTDTVAGDSLVSLAKQIIVDTGTDIPAALATIDAFHDVPATDSTDDVVMSDVIGKKDDTAVTTAANDKSLMGYAKGTCTAVNTDIPASIATVDANVDTILARESVVTATKTLTAQGGGAGKVVDLFTVTGTVECTAIYGECTEATDSTTCTNLLLRLFPAGGAGVDITATGTDCAGLVVGDILRSVTDKTTATQKLVISAASVSNEAFAYCVLQKQTGVTTTIQAEYTSDANTDIDIKWTIRYRPLSTDGEIAAA